MASSFDSWYWIHLLLVMLLSSSSTLAGGQSELSALYSSRVSPHQPLFRRPALWFLGETVRCKLVCVTWFSGWRPYAVQAVFIRRRRMCFDLSYGPGVCYFLCSIRGSQGCVLNADLVAARATGGRSIRPWSAAVEDWTRLPVRRPCGVTWSRLFNICFQASSMCAL